MRAVVVEKPGEVAVREVPSGICGTDIHIFRGEYLGTYPVIPGHEFSGVVRDRGSNVTRFKPGDHVSVEPITSIDKNAARLKLARSSGAAGVARSFEDLPKDGFDVVVDATGVPAVRPGEPARRIHA